MPYVIGGKKGFSYQGKSHIRIATKYQILLKIILLEGFANQIIKLNGAIELAANLKLSDAIIDLVSSGKTLAENDMFEIEKLMDVTSRLIVNRSSFKMQNFEINKIIKNFDVVK